MTTHMRWKRNGAKPGGGRARRPRQARALARYAATLFCLAVRSPLLWVSVLVASALLWVGVANMPALAVSGPYDRQSMQTNFDLYEQQEASASQREWLAREPSSLLEERAQEEFVDRGRVYDLMRAATDDRSYIKAILELLRHDEQYPYVGFSHAENEASQEFYQQLLRLEDSQLYESIQEMPAIAFFTYRWQEWFSLPIVSQLLASLAAGSAEPSSSAASFSPEAHLVMMVPAVVASACVFRWKTRRRLLDAVPLVRGAESTVGVLTAAACSLLAMAAVVLPGLVWLAAKNGLGNLSYPVVYFQAGEVVATTADEVILQGASLCVLATLVIALVLELSCCVTHRMAPGVIVASATVLAPLIPDYFDRLSPLASAAPWLPSTYLGVDKVVGGWSYFINTENDVLPIAGCDYAHGLLVLGGTALVLVTLVTAVHLFCHALRLYRMGSVGGPSGGSASGGGAHALEHSGAASSSRDGGAMRAKGARFSPRLSARGTPDVRRAFRDGARDLPAPAATVRSTTAAYLTVLLRGAAIPAAVVCEAAVLALPAVVPFRTGMEAYTQDAYVSRYQEHSRAQGGDLAAFSDPAFARRDIELLADAAWAPDARSFAVAAAAYEGWWAARLEEGAVLAAAAENPGIARSREEFYRRLSELDDPSIALVGSQLSPVRLVAFDARLYPALLGALPYLATGAMAISATRRGLLRQVPVRGWRRALSVASATIVVGLVGAALAWLPVLAVALIRCGWGEVAYPVIVWDAASPGLLPWLSALVGEAGASLPAVATAGELAHLYVGRLAVTGLIASVASSAISVVVGRTVRVAGAEQEISRKEL